MKKTKYLLIFLILLSVNLFGGSDRLVERMNYETSYEKALQNAKKANKPLMMVVGQEGCPYCNKFESKTLVHRSVHKRVEKDFIPLTILKFKDTYPEKFKPKGVPTVLFIDPKKEDIFYKSFGYKSKREYKVELKNALEIFNQEYKN